MKLGSMALAACVLSVFAGRPASAQEPAPPLRGEHEAVLAVVQVFFDTMATKDLPAAARVLMPEGRFHSVRQQDGKPVIRTFTNHEYLRDLPDRKQAVRERMWDPEVRIRDRIAHVWTPYDFWTDGKFSHCGVDAFDLVKTDEGWKIAGGTYTVESNCPPSPLGPLKQ